MTTDEAKPQRRKRQKRSLETRRKIMNAAMAEFAKFGFDGASTRGISKSADVPHSLVIHHFTNKDELWRVTVMDAVDQYLDRVFEIEAECPTAAHRLRLRCAEYIRFSADHPDFFRMITQENTLRSDRLSWLIDHHVRATTRMTADLIAQAQADGDFVSGDPMQLVYLFVGAATSPYRSDAELEILTGHRPAEKGLIEEHIRTCERLFFRGKAAELFAEEEC